MTNWISFIGTSTIGIPAKYTLSHGKMIGLMLHKMRAKSER